MSTCSAGSTSSCASHASDRSRSGPVDVHAPRARGLGGVADVQVVRERLGPVLPRMRGGVVADVRARPSRCRLAAVVLLQRLGVVGPLVAEQVAEPVQERASRRPGPSQYQCPISCRRWPSSVRYGSASLTRSASRCGSSPSARSMVMTPSACPVITGCVRAGEQVERQAVVGVLRCAASSADRGDPAGTPAAAWRLGAARTPPVPAVSSSAGRVRVSAQQWHSPPASIGVGEPVAARQLVVRHSAPCRRRGRLTSVAARRGRSPARVPQVKQRSLSKKIRLRQLSQAKARKARLRDEQDQAPRRRSGPRRSPRRAAANVSALGRLRTPRCRARRAARPRRAGVVGSAAAGRRCARRAAGWWWRAAPRPRPMKLTAQCSTVVTRFLNPIR